MEGLTDKQQYLSKNILDQGYDPEEFQDFMMHYSNKELDLNIWTLAELKTLVSRFQKFKQKNVKVEEEELEEFDRQTQLFDSEGSKISDPESKSMSEIHEEISKQEMEQMRKSSSVNSSLYQHFNFKKKTMLPELYVLVHIQQKPFWVSIRNYAKTVPNNIFKSSYIDYEIETSEGWKCRRRFTDFVWLHGYLKTKYDGLPIPPIPEKTTIRSFDQRHIEYRMLMLQQFLTILIQIPEICSQQILETFLRGNQEYFSQQKKQLQANLQTSLSSTTIESIHGSELLLMDQFSVEVPIINFYKKYGNLLGELSHKLDAAVEGMNKVEIELAAISSGFQELQGLVQDKIKGADYLGVMQEFCNGLSMHMTKSREYLKSQIYAQWNYQSMYSQNLLAQLQRCQKQHITLTQRHKNSMIYIPEEGSQAFTDSTNPSKQIQSFQIAKQQYRTKLSHTIRECRRYEEQQMLLLAKQWNSGLKNYVRDVSDWMIGCTDVLTKVMSVAEGKLLIEVEYVPKKKGHKPNEGDSG